MLARHAPQGHSAAVVQGVAQVPLLSPTLPDGQHMLLEQVPIQQSREALQAPPSDTHAAAQVPLEEQLPLAHWWLWLHLAPSGLLGLAQAMPGMEASAPPTRAAPINLSALLRERVPLASPLVSSSKE
jgi:hypothetical protein